MPKENKSSLDVTLEKSPSGTWGVPEAPGRSLRLQPWQRLWIISGAIYLVMLAGSYYMLMPDRESIERTMVFSVTEEVRRYDGMAFAGESPRKIFEAARSQGYAAWITATRARFRIGAEGNAGFEKIEKNCRDAVADLPFKRIIGILICAVAWLVPMAAFYAIGFGVEWVKRGLRGTRK